MRVDPGSRCRTLAPLVAVLLAGCGTGPAAAPATPASRTPAPTPDPVTVCTNQLTYWATEELRAAPDSGFDYQEMGLTGAQFDALGVLVAEARAQGPALPADWLAARARALCTQITAQPPRTGGGWP